MILLFHHLSLIAKKSTGNQLTLNNLSQNERKGKARKVYRKYEDVIEYHLFEITKQTNRAENMNRKGAFRREQLTGCDVWSHN